MPPHDTLLQQWTRRKLFPLIPELGSTRECCCAMVGSRSSGPTTCKISLEYTENFIEIYEEHVPTSDKPQAAEQRRLFLEATESPAHGALQEYPRNRHSESLDDATVKNATKSAPFDQRSTFFRLACQSNTLIPTN
jgi:hypothetical protein